MRQDAEFFRKRSQERFLNDDAEGGFADLDEAIRLDPSNAEYYWERGNRRGRHGATRAGEMPDMEKQQTQLELAVADYTKAIELAADSRLQAKVHRSRGYSFFILGQFDNLLMDATWLIEHGAGDHIVYGWRGHAKRGLGDLDAALEAYTTAIQLSPGYFDHRLQRGITYHRAKRYKEAIQDLTDVLSLPDMHKNVLMQVYQQRAFSYFRLGEFEKSFDDFNQSQMLGGDMPFRDVASYVQSIKNLEMALAARGDNSLDF